MANEENKAETRKARAKALADRARKLGMNYAAHEAEAPSNWDNDGLDSVYDDFEKRIVDEENYRKEQGDLVKEGYDERDHDVWANTEKYLHPDKASEKMAQKAPKMPTPDVPYVKTPKGAKPLSPWVGVRRNLNGDELGEYNIGRAKKK